MKGIAAIAVALVIAAVGASWFLSNPTVVTVKATPMQPNPALPLSMKCRGRFGARVRRAFSSDIACARTQLRCGESVGKAEPTLHPMTRFSPSEPAIPH